MMAVIDTLKRGYAPLYRTGSHCPGCGGAHWLLGRRDAECASCGTALPIAPVEAAPAAPSYPVWGARA